MRPNPVFTPDAVAALDAFFAEQRNSDCVIDRPQAGRSVGGAPLTDYTPVATTRCRVKVLGGAEAVSGGRWGPEVTWEVRLRRDPDAEGFTVRSDDRITVNGHELFVVTGFDAPTWGWELVVPCRGQQ